MCSILAGEQILPTQPRETIGAKDIIHACDSPMSTVHKALHESEAAR